MVYYPEQNEIERLLLTKPMLRKKKLARNVFQSGISSTMSCISLKKMDLWLTSQSPKFSSKKINTARAFKCEVIMNKIDGLI